MVRNTPYPAARQRTTGRTNHQGRRTTDFTISLSVRFCRCIGLFSTVLEIFRRAGSFSPAEDLECKAQEVTVVGKILEGLHLGALPDPGIAARKADAGENGPAQPGGARREFEVARVRGSPQVIPVVLELAVARRVAVQPEGEPPPDGGRDAHEPVVDLGLAAEAEAGRHVVAIAGVPVEKLELLRDADAAAPAGLAVLACGTGQIRRIGRIIGRIGNEQRAA